MKLKNRKNNRNALLLLLVLTLPLLLFMSYYLIFVFTTLIKKPTKTKEKHISISDISRPSYNLTPLTIDTDLIIFPSDYDNIIETLGTQLTQHQKTTLLLFGETISKSNHKNITDAYKELIEKNIPILIPQEYMNEYLNKRFDEYKLQLETIPKEIGDSINIEKPYF